MAASDLTKSFPERDGNRFAVVDGIDIAISAGQTICIVGPSGCGKTTLLRMLARLETSDSGFVRFGPSVSERGFAYIQQTPHLLPWRTVVQNAGIGLELKQQLHRESVRTLKGRLQSFGLSGFEDALPDRLSGGMQQKAALVCALTANPALLFCDEPFSAIDFVTRLQLLELFRAQCAVDGIASVHVTHNIEEAIFLADTVLVLSARPARVVATYQVILGKNRHDPVACRETPEFLKLFHDIWESLRRAL